MVHKDSTQIFLELLRQKFKGRARAAIENLDYDSIQALEEKLKEIFDPCMTPSQCRTALENVIKGSNEHIVDYINRVRTIFNNVLNAEATDRGREISNAERSKLEKGAITSFLNGIPPNLRLECKLKILKSLENAYTTAIKVYKAHAKDIQQTVLIYRVEIDLEANKFDRVKPVCGYCSKLGHLEEKCFKKKREKKTEEQKTKTGKECVLCHKQGHLIKECFKNPFNKNKRNTIKFNYCSKPGHKMENCFKKQKDEASPSISSETSCCSCQEKGHKLSKCPTFEKFERLKIEMLQKNI